MTTTTVIKAYPYVQFADDENIVAFFDAYNKYAQEYIDWFVNTPLAVYTNSNISGDLLTWVGAGIYGCYKTPVSFGNTKFIGPVNTYTPNYLPFNQGKSLTPGDSFIMSDELFKRVITWNFYKGDGVQLSIPWMKKRVARFLDVDMTDVSIKISENREVLIKISGDFSSVIENPAMMGNSAILNLPFGYTITVEAA